MRSVHHCLIHNTLLTPPEIKIELAIAEPTMATADIPYRFWPGAERCLH